MNELLDDLDEVPVPPGGSSWTPDVGAEVVISTAMVHQSASPPTEKVPEYLPKLVITMRMIKNKWLFES